MGYVEAVVTATGIAENDEGVVGIGRRNEGGFGIVEYGFVIDEKLVGIFDVRCQFFHVSTGRFVTLERKILFLPVVSDENHSCLVGFVEMGANLYGAVLNRLQIGTEMQFRLRR